MPRTTNRFWACLDSLPKEIQKTARKKLKFTIKESETSITSFQKSRKILLCESWNLLQSYCRKR